MGGNNDIWIRIMSDVDDLRKDMNSVRKDVGRMSNGFTANMAKMGLALSGVQNGLRTIYQIGRIAFEPGITAASDATEIASKFNVVMGESKDRVREWAAEFGNAKTGVGRSRLELEMMLSTLQDTLVPMGLERKAAADLSMEMVGLAVDVASFNNALDSEVIRDFQSTLVGNHETVRKYGIVITETTLQQAALNMGLIDTKRQLTEQEKIQARINILFAGTTDAQGDAKRTMHEFAGTVKRVRALGMDLAVLWGNELIPKATAFFNKLIEGGSWLEANFNPVMAMTYTIMQNISTILVTVTSGYLGYLAVTKSVVFWQTLQVLWTKRATIEQKLLNLAMKANPIGLLVGAITGLMMAFDLLTLFKKKDVAITQNVIDKHKELDSVLKSISQITSLSTLSAMKEDSEKQIILAEANKKLWFDYLSDLREGYVELPEELSGAFKRFIRENEKLQVESLSRQRAAFTMHIGAQIHLNKEQLDAIETQEEYIRRLKLDTSKTEIKANKEMVNSIAYMTLIEGKLLEEAITNRKAYLKNRIAAIKGTSNKELKEKIQLQQELNSIEREEAERQRVYEKRAEERRLMRLELAGETATQILQIRIDSLQAELKAEETTAQRKYEIQEELADRLLELDILNAKKKETFEGKLTATLQKYSAIRLASNLKERMETAKDTVMMGVSAAVAGVKGAAKMPFPLNLLAVPAVLAVIFAALSKAKSVGASIVKMGKGGAVSDPTLALFGEVPGVTELFAPQQDFIQYATQTLTPMIRAQVETKIQPLPVVSQGIDMKGLRMDISTLGGKMDTMTDAIKSQHFPTEDGIASAVMKRNRGRL